MPSPFPGMDPWLESPLFFGGLHSSLITLIKKSLQERLPEPYYAESEDRVWVDVSERYVEPDVNIIRNRTSTRTGRSDTGSAAVATRTPPIVARDLPPLSEEHTERAINIYTRRDDEEILVTALEVLSPANKTPGEGMWAYRFKQSEVITSDVHFVEIDLLRGGRHVTFVPREYLRALAGDCDYHVCVSIANDRSQAHLYPFRLTDHLPEIALPLLPGDGTIALDLQTVFDDAYDIGPYRRRLRYAQRQPDPPLTADQMIWAAGVLRERSLIPPETRS